MHVSLKWLEREIVVNVSMLKNSFLIKLIIN